MKTDQLEVEVNEIEYPSLMDRVKAALTDVVLLIIIMYGISDLFGMFDNVPGNIRVGTFIFLFVFYEPLFLSIFGGTVGHMLQGLRVKQENNETKNISFPLAIFRFGVKTALGWLSFLTMSGNKKKKAIHDIMVGSVVVHT